MLVKGPDCLRATNKSRDPWRDNLVNTKKNLVYKYVKLREKHTGSQVLKLLHYCYLCYSDRPDRYIGPCLSIADPTIGIKA